MCYATAYGIQSGLSRFTEATQPVRWTLPGGETLLVLEGTARIKRSTTDQYWS